MAGPEPRVRYLAAFRCPLGGLAAGKPRVLCHEAEIFVSTGSEFVYVYDQEGGLLTVVFQLPARVWHLELVAPRRALYALCAREGVYCLSLERPGRSGSQDDPAGEHGGDAELPSPVIPVGPEACVLPGERLRAFAVLDEVLVALEQGPAGWTLQAFQRPCPGQELQRDACIGEVVLSPCTPPVLAGEPEEPQFLPVLCWACLPGRGACGHLVLAEALFGLLFGADATLLESPVVLCGLPDGQLCGVVLRALVTSRSAPGDPKALVKVLHHLEEPVIFLGALRTEEQALDITGDTLAPGDAPADCLVALGHHGRTLAIRASWNEAGGLVPELREYCLPGPALCAASRRQSRLYYSTPTELCKVDLTGNASARVDPAWPEGGLPPLLCPAGLSICSAVALSVLPTSPGGGTKLLGLSTKGRLMACSLALDTKEAGPARVARADMGRRIKELLCGIGSVSERVSLLKKALDQRNKALASLHEAMDVSCALLSGPEGARPISCTITTGWSRLHLQDMLTATCQLYNSSHFHLDQGWTLCVQVFSCSSALALDSVSSAITYTVPIPQLGPSGRREVMLPLGPNESGELDLPMTVSCALFYSLREVLGEALASEDALEEPCPAAGPLAVLREQGGVCLPLSRHMVDMLQCLRFPGLPAAPSLLGPGPDPVDTFLESCQRAAKLAGPASLRAKYLPPSVASIKVSAELLRTALQAGGVGGSLSCATLRWLLAENPAADAVRAQALSSIRGVAPDGTDVHLIVREVALTDLSPAGPIEAVEIQVECSSLASLCRTHHAITGRMQAMVMEQATQGSNPPELRVQYLRQIHANHEMLLREVQALRDQLCTEDETGACAAAQRLLEVYGQLRNPSLVLL
ncbi:Fanconi anemia core complex-associated protein 100 [Ochotona curzoniae]|uniref:Fanconi anemia core complex-associated protein 100 n=1 Tax=Ochotona curzoniae TaxID=130825 RepID=UPI001B34E66B|nr:Fanconi anemia core complex-associated protein 100 [Ochotona curzoniae]